jgi:cobalt/nickel transport system ATP-binding protein
VALATVLAIQPSLVLLDEPTAALDPRARRAFLGVMAALEGTLLVATHDLDAALTLGGRVLLLCDGKVIADGPASRILRDADLLDAAGLELPLSLKGH